MKVIKIVCGEDSEFGEDTIFEIPIKDRCECCDFEGEVWVIVDDLSGVAYCEKCIHSVYENCDISVLKVKDEKELTEVMKKSIGDKIC